MPNRYWFRPKTYGYGAFPSTWEGWAVVIGFGLAIAASSFVLLGFGAEPTAAAWIVWTLVVLALTVAVVAISWWKTEGEWRWRGGKRGWLN